MIKDGEENIDVTDEKMTTFDSPVAHFPFSDGTVFQLIVLDRF